MNETKKASGAIYIAPIVYVLGMYLMPVVLWALGSAKESADNANRGWVLALLIIPIILGLVNLAVVLILGKKISRGQLLICTRIIKYALIPFYFLGGLCIAVALLLMFTPVVIMVFVGPAIAILLSAIGWLGLLGAAPFSVAYIVRAYKEGVHGKALSVFAAIFQFFFTMDVIFVIILAIKDRVYTAVNRQFETHS